MKSPYWQHNEPLKCPYGHPMEWLGSAYWICSYCPKNSNRLWVATDDGRDHTSAGSPMVPRQEPT